MDWSGLPSLNSLRAFVAVAETGGYSRAARALNVTRAAIGQQVRALEAFLGVALVERVGRGIVLTASGARLARELDAGFSRIRRGVDAVSADRDARPVHLTMSPAFAVEWLMPRLPAFRSLHPEVTLLLNPTADLVDLRRGGADIAIRYSNAGRVSAGVSTVLISDMVVIGAPSLVGGRGSDPAGLAELPWLQELGTTEVLDWFRARNITPENPPVITEMPGHMIMQAVRRGDGISYTARAFFLDDLRAGRVVELSSEPLAGYYCIETAPGLVSQPAGKVLKWLEGAAETVTVTGETPAQSSGAPSATHFS